MTNRHPENHGEVPTGRSGIVEGSGRSIEEAIQGALATLGLDRNDVDVEVVDEGSRGVLGLGAREARVRVRPRPRVDRVALIGAVAEELVRLMGFEVTITAAEGAEIVHVQVQGANLAALIGKHGQTLAAMETVAALVAGRRLGVPVRVEMDVMGYRDRRRVALEALARRTAGRVARTHREVALTPMDARDRRIIHITLQEHPAVATASQGEGDLRRVVIMPKGVAEPTQERQDEPEQWRRTAGERRQTGGEGEDHHVESGQQGSGYPERGGNQNSYGRRPSGSRLGRLQDRTRLPTRGSGRGTSRKPSGAAAPAGLGSRPEGLPVDEELEAEIQAHLEKMDRERATSRSAKEPGTASPENAEPQSQESEPPREDG